MNELIDKLPSHIKKVADCGSGAGYWPYLFAQRGLQVTAIETQENRLGVLRELEQIPDSHITVCDKDVHDLSNFADASFDMSFSSFVMHVLDQPEVALAEMIRITRKDGFICICLSNPLHPLNQFAWQDAKNVKLHLTQEFIGELLQATCKPIFTLYSHVQDNRVTMNCGDIPLAFFAVYQKI